MLVRFLVVALTAASVGLGQVSAASAVEPTRLAGSDRIATAVAVSHDAFPGGANVAILASAQGFADALSAAPLAGAEGAPVLLNTPQGLHPAVASELERLDPALVLIMGGPKAQGAGVMADVRAQGRTAMRISGPNRFATAAAVAQRAVDRWLQAGDGAAGREVVIALGAHPLGEHRAWPDALAAGVFAGITHRPLLLVTRDSVPAETGDALREMGATRVTIVGGPGAISDGTAQSLGLPYVRLAGPDRYATGAALANAAVAAGADASDVTLVTGADYPDALGAVAGVLQRGGVLLLIDGSDLDRSPASRDWLAARGTVDRLAVVGGFRAVSDPTMEQVVGVLDGIGGLRLTLEPVVAARTPLAVRGDHLGRLVVAEREGRVRVLVNGQLQTMVDIRQRVSTSGERGLLDLQLHPNYSENRRFFVHYSDNGGDTVLSEFRANTAGTGLAGGESVLYTTSQPASNHNGGGLQFLPDGTLLLALGDGGGANDQFGNGQNIATPLGSLLRFDVGTPGVARAAAGNPYISRSGNNHIWASGLRNPYRISLDQVTGVLYVADVGQNAWEEVNAVAWDRPGLDYGWSTVEGPNCFQAVSCDRTGLTAPVATYDHGGGRCSITGGSVHRGEIGALRGHYFYGDFCSGQIFSFRLEDGQAVSSLQWTSDLDSSRIFGGQLFTFGEVLGEIYVANGSQIYRIVRG